MNIDASWPAILLGLRIGVAALLYLFLLTGFQALRRELRLRSVVARAASASSGPAASTPPRTEARPSQGRGVQLRVLDDGGDGALVGQAFRLDGGAEGVAEVGRSASNAVVLADRRVSARHARIVRRDGGWWVEDLGSTNGTFVDERPVQGAARIRRDTRLRFGPVVARLERAAAE
ncbi:MAG: FHA domain-containing protein [Dehalococcoidia bacterium]